MSPGRPNIVDSSAWLAYFADEPNAESFAPAIEDSVQLVVPTICLLEVFKVVARQRGEGEALQAVAAMQQGTVVDVDAALAISAARLGASLGLPLADSIVYAVAQRVGGVVWTQDADFEGIEGVIFSRSILRHDFVHLRNLEPFSGIGLGYGGRSIRWAGASAESHGVSDLV